jgi:hypothetical protein
VRGGPVVATAAVGSVALCWGVMALIGRTRGDEAPASQTEPHAAHVLAGDPE